MRKLIQVLDNRLRCAGLVMIAVAAVVFAGAAQAVVVQYTSTSFSGLGDPFDVNPAPTSLVQTPNGAWATPNGVVNTQVTPNGNFVIRPDLAANGLPACQQGLTPHQNAVVPAAGVAKVTPINGYPGVKFTQKPYQYGTAMGTGSWTNPSVMSNMTWMGAFNVFGGAKNAHDLAAGNNGAAQLSSATCSLFFTANILFGAKNLDGRTHMTNLTWPNKPVTAGQRPLTFDMTVGKDLGWGGASAGAPHSGNLSPIAPDPNIVGYNMYAKAVAGPNKFGGGIRGTGGGNIHLTAVVGVGQTIMGGWASGPRILGHGGQGTKVTQLVTQMAIMQHNLVGPIPVTLQVWNFPYTTGFVSVQDDNRAAVPPGFQSLRQSTGYDNRNAAGTSGDIQLISPFVGTLQNLNLYFSGNQRSVISFAPEPAATGMLGVGVFVVLGLHIWQRRRS